MVPIQAAREGRGRDTGADVVHNEEQAAHELQQQDAERERALEVERQLERDREAYRGRGHGLER